MCIRDRSTISRTLSNSPFTLETTSQPPPKRKEEPDITQTKIYKILKQFKLQQYARVSRRTSVGNPRVWVRRQSGEDSGTIGIQDDGAYRKAERVSWPSRKAHVRVRVD
eukprot:TRINITY_DN3372_c0_g2_i4.p2 TRINITY_DN3372_c0_g2~~TRINITY_DN3372_c0_g2_i4.p2  ORF type:complete len:109 (-),score=8.34 TRINITY_DN3372_c0_g2_i4:740-1066(-)